MKRTLSLMCVVLMLSLTGCYKYKGELPGVLRRIPPTEYTVVGNFEVEIKRKWWLFGFAKIHDDLESEIREAVLEKGGNGATNIRITTETSFQDVLWTSLLFFALVGGSRHMVVTGQVIKFNEDGEDDAEP